MIYLKKHPSVITVIFNFAILCCFVIPLFPGLTDKTIILWLLLIIQSLWISVLIALSDMHNENIDKLAEQYEEIKNKVELLNQ